MLSSLFLIGLFLRWMWSCVRYVFWAFMEWTCLILLWLISPQQALECYHEMEASDEQQESL